MKIDVSAGVGDVRILDFTQTLKIQLDVGSRISQLLMTYLTGLNAIGGQVPEMHAEVAQEAVVALLAAALKGEATNEVADRPRLEAALRQRVLTFIGQNIHRSELSPTLIMRHFNVSRSHLYRAFASDGGVAKLLRDTRLDVAIRELTRAGGSAASIAELAHSLGFSSGNQFLRVFRNRFGMTPSQARNKGPALRAWPQLLHVPTEAATGPTAY